MLARLLTVGLTLALIAIAAPAGESQPVDLAQLAGWDIVLGEDASPSEAHAADEFRSIVKEATGHDLQITKAPDRPERHVFIGSSKAMQASPVGFAVDRMLPEDLRIVARDQLIAIAGGRPRGTLYAVYTFVEDYLGVRFLTAGHTHVPKVAAKAVIGPVDRHYHPPLMFRSVFYGENSRDPAFAVKLRLNTVSDDPKLGGKTGHSLITHTFGAQIPTSKYGKDHPEYYALRDGKRLNSGNDWMENEPCLTHPDVLRIVTDAVLADLKANPWRENISVSQNDNSKFCLCPECKAIDGRENSRMGTLLEFVNKIADVVAKEHPGVKVGTLSYRYTRKPPKTLKPRPNVQIQLCSIECCTAHAINDPKCEKNVRFCSDMATWGKLSNDIFIWNYNTNYDGYLLPCPNLRVIEPNVRYFVTNGAKGIHMQASGDNVSSELSDLRNYVIANLLWDPTRKADVLMDEFLDLHYGAAAPPIRRFINKYHDHVAALDIHPTCYGKAKAFGIDETIAKDALNAFSEAMTLADSDALKARVEKAAICAYRAAIDPALEAPANKLLEPALAGRMRPLVKRFFELCAKYKVINHAEDRPLDAIRERLRNAFGLKQSEEF